MPDEDAPAPVRQGSEHSHPQYHRVTFRMGSVHLLKN